MEKEEKLEAMRHSLAHLLAAAVLELYPDTKRAIGPTIDNGFYYDFEFSSPLSENDLPKIAKKMRELLPSWETFAKIDVTADDARRIYADNPYKLELINEFDTQGELITLYYSGPRSAIPSADDLRASSFKLHATSFLDLCRGGHSESPAKDIAPDAFTLSHIAGAYWRGNEKNKMLTRIYGLAFLSKKELDAYIKQREEAKKRDHRKLGRELDLFTFSDLVGPGLPLWTPKGTRMRHLLDAYVWELRQKYGYERVAIPHLTKRDLYETSGHWEKFGDELFRIETREGKEFAVKPMNCPHHTQIFDRVPHSYREMPQRYAETTMVYRDEQSGELGGLTRVISITQDDSHVFCRHNQVRDEFFAIWDIVDTFYKTFGFNLKVRLSFRDQEQPEKYLGTEEIWRNAEESLRSIAKERGADYFEAPGEAAMYGPKLDFMATDSLGREHQVATIQLDMNLPERFDLTCVNEKGEKERVVMIHCAIMGSIERFMAVLIEHLGGNFPLWLAPVQVKILPISDKHTAYAGEVLEALGQAGIRAEVDESSETLGKKIREAKVEKVPYMLVVGDKEMDKKTVMVESRDNGKLGAMSVDEAVRLFADEIAQRA